MKAFSILLLLLASTYAQAQLDSLRAAFAQYPPDTTRLSAYADLLRDLSYDDPALALQLIADAQPILKQAGDNTYKGRFKTYEAIAIASQGDQARSLPLFEEAIRYYARENDSLGIATVYTAIGLSYHFTGEAERALEYYLRGLPIYERMEKWKPASQTLNNIAVLYRAQKKYDQAIDIYNRSLVLKEKLGDTLGIANTYQNLGTAKTYQEDTTAALAYFEKALTLFQQLNLPLDVAACRVSIGIGNINLGRLDEGLTQLRQAYEVLQGHTGTVYYLYCLYGLGICYNNLQDFAPAEKYLLKGLDQLEMTDKLDFRRAFYKALSEALAGRGKFPSAYEYLQKSLVLQDTLQEQSRVATLEELQTKYEVQVKDLELERRRLSQRNLTGLSIGLVLLALTALAFLYVRSRTARLLREKNLAIAAALSEKETLLKEIHHRVKNNLQFVSSLLNLQSRFVSDEGALQALRESRSRVQAMSLLHQQLYQRDQLTAIDMPRYLDELTQSIFSAYNLAPERIQLGKSIEPLVLDVESAIPIGLILNELICNAIKHAFPGEGAGKLEIALRRETDNLVLEVSDNGKGIADETNLGKGQSFGFRLIHLLVEKLSATLEVRGQAGAHFRLIIPQTISA